MNIFLLVSIALLTPVTHPSLEQIEQGFKESLPSDYQIDVYNAQGNKTLMRSEIEEIARRNYDLLFTLGTAATQMAVEVFAKKGLTIPIVFTCVNDPLTFNIRGNYVTGVEELLNFKEELAALLKYKPDTKKVLLVYNPSEPGLQKDQREVEKILKEQGIALVTVETFQTNEIKAKVSPFIEDVDAVIVLKDNTVVSALDGLIKLCDIYHIPLMASDLDSPLKGAAFGYGVYEREFGVEGAKKALLILKEKVVPREIPITGLSNFSLKINEEAAKKQGITCFSP